MDFLTPLEGPDSTRPVYLPAFKVSARPLRLLDFLIENPVQAVVVGKKTGVLVNAPDPARFVLHKLWTSRVRGAAWQSKARKDLLQAGLLLEVLLDDRSEDLALAGEVLARQPAALRLTRCGAEQLAEELRERLFAELPSGA